ncbi:MAG: hypothetical protein IJB55_02625 [Firmicutes bacterium]|nr:hypothetical protein [Bacillota bacterium]
MKKIFSLLLVAVMLLGLAACGGTDNTKEATVGETLLADFQENAEAAPQEIADALLQNEMIEFMGATMAVEPGFLVGFDNAEITGFEEGVMFAPAIGTIPFVGYIFTLGEDADVDAFKQMLQDNANLRWNICTAAEEMIVESEGNTVFFLMCPTTFEQPEEGADGGMALN